jgi:nicotinamidase-related amidase
MLRLDDTFFVLIDVQGKLSTVMHEREALIENCLKAVQCMQALDIPIVWTEQIPAKMGETVTELSELLGDTKPIEKISFSCCGEPSFVSAVEALGRKRAIVAGMETHVCVYQTAADLFAAGYHVEVLADAVSSRTPENKLVGLEKMKIANVEVSSVETVVFELMRTAEHPSFRDILKIVK